MKSFEDINKRIDDLLEILSLQQEQLNTAESSGLRSSVERCANAMYDTRMQITTLYWVVGDSK